MDEFYSPGHLATIYPFLEGLLEPEWLLLGGPADANEAQTAREKWPSIKVVGVDPNPDVIPWQKAHGWPEGQPIIYAALSDKVGTVRMANTGSTLRHASLYLPELYPDRSLEDFSAVVPSVSWDSLDVEYGPFRKAILWMDVEHSEYNGLLGALGIIARGDVLLINVEEMLDNPGNAPLIQPLLESYGYHVVHEWNACATCRDRIYMKR